MCTCQQVITQVIVPLVASLIGGAMTIAGVVITLRHQSKAEKSQKKLEAFPYLYSLERNKNTVNSPAHAPDIILKMDSDGAESEDEPHYLLLHIQNSSNGIALINRIENGSETYYPIGSGVIDKDKAATLGIELLPRRSHMVHNWKLYVNDIYKNEYCYEVCLEKNVLKLGKYFIKHEK